MPKTPNVEQRLRDGIAWARTEGHVNLQSLLEGILGEIQEFQRQARHNPCPRSHVSEEDVEELRAGNMDFEKRIGELERAVSDLGVRVEDVSDEAETARTEIASLRDGG